MTPKEFYDQFKTHQQVYEYVVGKLWEQGDISKMFSGICAYRSADGMKKCAIGHLIPDKCYNEGMECHNLDEIIDNYHDTMNPDLSDMVNFFNRFSTDVDDQNARYDNFFSVMQTMLHDRYGSRDPDSTVTYQQYLRTASLGFANQYGLVPYTFPEA